VGGRFFIYTVTKALHTFEADRKPKLTSSALLRCTLQSGFGYSGHGPSFDPTGEGDDKDAKLLHTEFTKTPLPDDFDDDDLS
jgi:hypothetical protein